MEVGEAPARASCGPCSGDPFVEDYYRISLDDCNAYYNFRVHQEDMACLEDIKVPCFPIRSSKRIPGQHHRL